MRLTLVIDLALLVAACSTRQGSQLRFRLGRTTVDFPITVEVYYPQGLKVSIPHKDGLEIFSFHGKINSPLSDIDGGTLAQDITGRTHGEWVFESTSTELKVGDVLNFWVFLQYRGAGQRFNDLSHIVKNLSPAPFPQLQSSPAHQVASNYERQQATAPNRRVGIQTISRLTSTPRPSASIRPESAETSNIIGQECSCNDETLRDVWAQMNATASKMRTLEENYSPLQEKLDSLTETVDELIKNMNIGTNLLLTGDLPVRTNPVEDVRHLLIEKLKLHDLSTSILQAEYKNNGIAFEVASSIDKLRILKRSKDILSKLSYQIIDPDRPPFDVRNAK